MAQCKKRLGVSPLISSVFIVSVILVSTIIVMNVVMPNLQKGREIADIDTAKKTLFSIDSAIKELIYEAPGAKRIVSLVSYEGQFRVSSGGDFIQYFVDTESSLFEPGSISKEGDIIITYGPGVKAYESDIDQDGDMDLVLENDAVLFAIRKLYNSTNHGFINTSNETSPFISLMKNKRLDINSTPVFGIYINDLNNTRHGQGYTELVEKGDDIPGASIRLYLNATDNPDKITYDAFFTLLPGQDFVRIEVKPR